MTEEELVEKVARALALAESKYSGNTKPWHPAARAAIAAMREAGAVFPAVIGTEPAVKTLSQEEAAAVVFSVLNHPTRI